LATAGPPIIKPEFGLLSPWVEPFSSEGLVRELQRELAAGDELYGKPAEVLVVARDRDDVLFAVAEAVITKYAVVHLTWGHKEERLPRPGTKLFDSLNEWLDFMKVDHDDYTSSDR
jgi:hypothetical protein